MIQSLLPILSRRFTIWSSKTWSRSRSSLSGLVDPGEGQGGRINFPVLLIKTVFEGDLVYAPVIRKGYWEVELTDFALGDKN